MSDLQHKFKCSFQDTRVDLSKMKMALYSLYALKEELYNIWEAEREMNAVMNHIKALEDILNKAKKPKMNFSTVSMSELQQLGVQYGRLIINEPVLATLASSPPPKVATEIQALTNRLIEIYDCVDMDYEAGTHMLLDAILLSLRRIASAPPLDVAILPELPLASVDGVHIANYRSGYELFLTGSIDYAVIQYEDVKDYKDRLLLPDVLRDCFNLPNVSSSLSKRSVRTLAAVLWPRSSQKPLAKPLFWRKALDTPKSVSAFPTERSGFSSS